MDTTLTGNNTSTFRTMPNPKQNNWGTDDGDQTYAKLSKEDDVLEIISELLNEMIDPSIILHPSIELLQRIYEKVADMHIPGGFSSQFKGQLLKLSSEQPMTELTNSLQQYLQYNLIRLILRISDGGDLSYADYNRPNQEIFVNMLCDIAELSRFFHYIDEQLHSVDEEYRQNIREADKIFTEYKENIENIAKIEQEIADLTAKNEKLENELKEIIPERNRESDIVSQYIADLREIKEQFEGLDRHGKSLSREIKEYEHRITEINIRTPDDVERLKESIEHLEKLIQENTEKQKIYTDKRAELSKEDSQLETAISQFQEVNTSIAKLSEMNIKVGQAIKEKTNIQNEYDELLYKSDTLGCEATELERHCEDLKTDYERTIVDHVQDNDDLQKENQIIINEIALIETEIGNQSSIVAKSEREVSDQRKKNANAKVVCERITTKADKIVEDLRQKYKNYCITMHRELTKI